jgi:nitrite reductase/ring-hydroxylating ferredoxin subunit
MSSLADRDVYEVGKFYRVPCVYWNHREWQAPRWWPILGDWHEDAELINFPAHHFHIDARFVAPRHKTPERREAFLKECVRWPIQRDAILIINGRFKAPNPDTSAPSISYRWRKCQRAEFTVLRGQAYRDHFIPFWMQRLEDHYQAIELKRPICPHKGAPLNGPTDAEGCVTCPLHGLRFKESTGCLVRHTAPV